ncbi:putative mitochondrial import inner membrane translocase subunit tim54 [Amylocarpus encephaloides]|uniref:Mitochondrial import inner membrane translocase subunit TIM54 n=1 Tax=Amylocarpus encephaloides TaxID=45428 RepID=A0A9P8C3T7_9HELO|nr:putative mitochondrial import inner membrane translocase subunit tim54 [Amylocarpus encephaloides]
MAAPSPLSEGVESAPKPQVKPEVKFSKPNPIYKYMGLGENFRPKLPSRNWMIFLSITGSFTAAVIYDKREKKRVQRKWCKLVEHIAKEPLDPKAMPRKLTVFLEAPPSDGLRSAQDHFKDYVKPILVASGLDWEFIQGRKEGDIRTGLAEKIRNLRRPAEERTEESPIMEVRAKSGIQEYDGPRGDIVIGRHTWKEYIRGLHEGWLGPLVEPPKPVEAKSSPDSISPETGTDISSGETASSPPQVETLKGITIHDTSSTPEGTEKPTPEPTPAAEKSKTLAPFISVTDYKTASAPTQLPIEFDPSTPISFPHILGFLNTPRRIYRFLNRRALADSIGRDTAAIILSTHRPYYATSSNLPTSFAADDTNTSPQASSNDVEVPQTAEQQSVLFDEEKEWHKSVRVRKEDEPERTWLEHVTLDPRIASRMRKSELIVEEEERAKRIVIPEEEIEGWIKGGLRSLGRSGKEYLGFGKEKTKPLSEGLEETLE